MTRRTSDVNGPQSISRGDLADRYSSIREALQSTTPDDLDHKLPNLASTLREASRTTDDTVRFHVGVSFTETFSPLDYYLHRLTDGTGRQPAIETLKEAASDHHFYLQFYYPTDPNFDVNALRGAMLTAVDQKRQAISDFKEAEKTTVSGIWKHLAGGVE